MKFLITSLILLNLCFLALWTANMTVNATSYGPGRDDAFVCGELKVVNSGKDLAWTCQDSDEDFVSSIEPLKTSIDESKGEMKYQINQPHKKIDFSYKDGVLSYSGFVNGVDFVKDNGIIDKVPSDKDFKNLDFTNSGLINIDYQSYREWVKKDGKCTFASQVKESNNEQESPVFARKIQGEKKIDLSKAQILNFLKPLNYSPDEIVYVVNYKKVLDQDSQKVIQECKENLEQILKEPQTLTGIARTDLIESTLWLNIADYKIPLSFPRKSQEFTDFLATNKEKIKPGDSFEIKAKLNLVEIQTDEDFLVRSYFENNSNFFNKYRLVIDKIISSQVAESKNAETTTVKGETFLDLNGNYLFDENEKLGCDQFSGVISMFKLWAMITFKFDTNLFDPADSDCILDQKYVSDIKVIATDDQNKTYETFTNSRGEFEFKNLPINKQYSIKVDIDTLKGSYHEKSLNIMFLGGDVDYKLYLNGSNPEIDLGPIIKLWTSN